MTIDRALLWNQVPDDMKAEIDQHLHDMELMVECDSGVVNAGLLTFTDSDLSRRVGSVCNLPFDVSETTVGAILDAAESIREWLDERDEEGELPNTHEDDVPLCAQNLVKCLVAAIAKAPTEERLALHDAMQRFNEVYPEHLHGDYDGTFGSYLLVTVLNAALNHAPDDASRTYGERSADKITFPVAERDDD